MANKNNPAGRLYALLEQAISIGEGVRTEDVWREIFQTQPDDPAELWRCILELHKLYEETIESLRSVQDSIDSHTYINVLTNIKNAINPLRLDLEWRHFRSSLNERVMTTLQFCDDILSRKSSEILVDENELMEILKEVSSLTENILRSELDFDIKVLLIKQLENIRQAILDYRLHGSSSLRKGYEDTVGGVVVNSKTIKENENTEGVKSYGKLWDRFATVAKSTYKIAKFVYEERAFISALPTKFSELYTWAFPPSGSPPALPPAT